MTEAPETPAPELAPGAPEPPRQAPRLRPRKPDPTHPLLGDLSPDAPPSPRKPWIGCPVQFCGDDGSVVPGVLQRESLTEPGIFDVKISPHGAALWVTRYAVRRSEKPTPGCWSFGPA